MDISPYIQPAITVISSAAVLLILREQIKSQQDQINTMKAYMDIFKLDEVKKYVEMTGETKRQEANINAINNVIKDVIPELVASQDNHTRMQLKELIDNTCSFLFANYDESQINELVKERYKYTGHFILNSYKYRNDHPKEKPQTQA